MSEAAKNDVDAQNLRRSLHEKIDRLPVSKLALADRVLVQMEVDELRGELDLAYDRDRNESKLAGQKVDAAIALHRARHPYKG